MARQKAYEEPTPHLKLVNGELRQRWRIVWRDYDTTGAANPETEEWRTVPREDTP